MKCKSQWTLHLTRKAMRLIHDVHELDYSERLNISG